MTVTAAALLDCGSAPSGTAASPTSVTQPVTAGGDVSLAAAPPLSPSGGGPTRELAETHAPEVIIEDVAVGTGEAAAAGDHITVHYVGTLENGSEFDSSRKRNRPFDFVLGRGQVIKGWDQGVVGMKVGGHRKLTVPPLLGYGAGGQPPVIPPDAVLKFDVELLSIEHPSPAELARARTITARHILIEYMGARNAEGSIVRTREQARDVAGEVLQRAKAGDDFARLAVEYSDEPGAGARGGALGRFGHGKFVPEFDAAAFSLKPGEISTVVETPFGYHIIQRLE